MFGALAAGLGMALAGNLFKPKRGPSETSTVTQELSPYEKRYWQFISDRAINLAQQPYTRYQGDRVADLNANQRAGINNAVQATNQWRPTFDAARTLAGRSATPFNENSLNPYMSPYMSGVVDEIGRLGDERFSGLGGLKEQIGDEFVGNGQFASERHGKVLADAAMRNERETLGQQRQALQSGYEQAMGAYQTDKDRELRGSGALSALAGQQQALAQGDTNALLGVGGLEQQQLQRELDVPYQDFLEQRDWEMNRLQQAAQAAQGMTGSRTQTTTTPGPFQPSPIQNFLGGVGLYMGLNNAYGRPTTSYGYRRGGAVYRRGGPVNYRKGGLVKKKRVGGLKSIGS